MWVRDGVADPWGTRSAYGREGSVTGPGGWATGRRDVDRWVPAASLLHSNGDAMDIASRLARAGTGFSRRSVAAVRPLPVRLRRWEGSRPGGPTIPGCSGEERLVGCLAAIWIRMVARRFCRPEITEVAVGRITERLAAVFRRSHGDNRPVASAVAVHPSAPVALSPAVVVPSSVPRSPALVVAAGPSWWLGPASRRWRGAPSSSPRWPLSNA
jgi:hypothetical protein